MELGVYADPAHVIDRRPGVSSPFHGTSQPVGGGVKECNGFLSSTWLRTLILWLIDRIEVDFRQPNIVQWVNLCLTNSMTVGDEHSANIRTITYDLLAIELDN